MGLLTFGMLMAAGLLTTPGAVQYIDLQDGWTVENTGAWQSRVDHRNLLAMHHPWTPSEANRFSMAQKTVVVPTDWGDTVTLHFYSSDDYHGVPVKDTPGTGFVGHRRKQILVNSNPIWTHDVADAVVPGVSSTYQVTIQVPESDRSLRIALLAYDAVASSTVLKEDFYTPRKPGMGREDDPEANRFRTTIYWGDLTLVSGNSATGSPPRPSERLVLKRHNRYWPPAPPESNVWTKEKTKFTLSAPGGLPKAGFPLEMGIPLPLGAADSPESLRFTRGDGQRIYTQKQVTDNWPDGSLRWLLAQMPVKPSTGDIALAFTKDGASPAGSVKVVERDAGLKVSSGAVSLEQGGVDPIDTLSYRGKTAFTGLQLALEVAGKVIPGTNDNGQVVEEGPFHTRLVMEGRFEGLDTAYGTYALYCSVYHDLPYVKFWFRYFNDTPSPQSLSQLNFTLALPAPLDTLTLPHGTVDSPLEMDLQQPDVYRANGASHVLSKPFFLQWSQGALVVKDFAQLHPKGLQVDAERLTLSLVAGGPSPVTFAPGEAKSHEIWLALGPTDGAQLAATVARPPILINANYFNRTGVFGPAAPVGADNPWVTFAQNTYGEKSLSEIGMHTGLRHYPDEPYLGRSGAWSNNYNGRLSSLWSTWLATGDRAWFDRAAAFSSHLMDVAIVHSEVPGQDWLGALHGPGANHVAGPWNPLLRGEGFAHFARWTGNPEAESAFLGIADFCVRTHAGRRGPNVRHWAGPFSSIVAAYRDTGEIGLLEAGTERLTGMLRQVDRRRGTWIDWHGDSTYPGNIPWMTAQLAQPLYSWYHETGDVEAAQLLVGLAESLICENTPWDGPGRMDTYSPAPWFSKTTAYDPFIIPLIGAAYELTEDPFFKEAALAQWKRWRDQPEFQSAFNLSWHLPWLNAVLAEWDAESSEP